MNFTCRWQGHGHLMNTVQSHLLAWVGGKKKEKRWEMNLGFCYAEIFLVQEQFWKWLRWGFIMLRKSSAMICPLKTITTSYVLQQEAARFEAISANNVQLSLLQWPPLGTGRDIKPFPSSLGGSTPMHGKDEWCTHEWCWLLFLVFAGAANQCFRDSTRVLASGSASIFVKSGEWKGK